MEQPLEEILHKELSILWFMEEKMMPVLDEVMNITTDRALRSTVWQHIQETRVHRDNMASILEEFGSDFEFNDGPSNMLVQAARTKAYSAGEGDTRDIIIASYLHKLEMSEIASYTVVLNLAAVVWPEIQQRLQENLQQDAFVSALALSILSRITENS